MFPVSTRPASPMPSTGFSTCTRSISRRRSSTCLTATTPPASSHSPVATRACSSGPVVYDDLPRRAVYLLRRRDRPGGRARPRTAGAAFPGLTRRTPARRQLGSKTLLDYVKRSLALRKTYRPLCCGSYRRLDASDDVVVFACQAGEETLVIALNASNAPARLAAPGCRSATGWKCARGSMGRRHCAGRQRHPQRRAQYPRAAGWY